MRERAINERQRQSAVNESNISRFTNFSFMILKSNKGIVQPYLNMSAPFQFMEAIVGLQAPPNVCKVARRKKVSYIHLD